MPRTDPEPTDFERRLAALKPSPAAIDRDRMLYEAGLAAGRRDRLPLALAAGMALVAVALGGLLARERSERRALEVVIAARIGTLPSVIPPSARPIEPESYQAFRRQVIAGRLDQTPRDQGDPAMSGLADSPSPTRVRGRVADL